MSCVRTFLSSKVSSYRTHLSLSYSIPGVTAHTFDAVFPKWVIWGMWGKTDTVSVIVHFSSQTLSPNSMLNCEFMTNPFSFQYTRGTSTLRFRSIRKVIYLSTELLAFFHSCAPKVVNSSSVIELRVTFRTGNCSEEQQLQRNLSFVALEQEQEANIDSGKTFPC